MTTNLTTTQRTTIHLDSITDRRGKPARIDGAPAWTADNDLLTLEPSDDGMSCRVSATGETGSCRVSITADADLGEGVKPLEHFEFFSIIAAPATTINVGIDQPEEIEDEPEEDGTEI